MGKEVITAIYSSKASAFDWTLGEISELPYILADLLVWTFIYISWSFQCVWMNPVLHLAEKSQECWVEVYC